MKCLWVYICVTEGGAIHTYKHTHTYIHTHTHTQIHIATSAHTKTHNHMCTHIITHTNTSLLPSIAQQLETSDKPIQAYADA